jgi:hypothetical protein
MLISKVMIKKVNGGKACDVIGMLNIAKGTLGCVDIIRRLYIYIYIYIYIGKNIRQADVEAVESVSDELSKLVEYAVDVSVSIVLVVWALAIIESE